MGARKQVLKLVEKGGASLEERDPQPQGELLLEAPRGCYWNATGTHELVSLWTPGLKDEAWRDLLNDARQGFSPCYTEQGKCECGACNSEGRCDWWDHR